MYSRRYTPERITELAPDEIFVFGSNLAGVHGGGAARLAYQRFGAVWGEGVGHHGQTYAIPTMQGGVDTIKPYVDDFIRYAKAHPNLTFLVTRMAAASPASAIRILPHSLRMLLKWTISSFPKCSWTASPNG